jgi:hypothetical protein
VSILLLNKSTLTEYGFTTNFHLSPHGPLFLLLPLNDIALRASKGTKRGVFRFEVRFDHASKFIFNYCLFFNLDLPKLKKALAPEPLTVGRATAPVIKSISIRNYPDLRFFFFSEGRIRAIFLWIVIVLLRSTYRCYSCKQKLVPGSQWIQLDNSNSPTIC